ncbi:MAG: hypothetical protein JSR73_11855 [Proteobacteria bacterium]|nr:hypothetical protein [Pseudomonadota bacterium]
MVIGPTTTPVELLVASAPVQPPEAVQLVALVEVHVSVDVPPLATLVGFAVKVTEGIGGGEAMLTVTDCDALPPAPVHSSVNVVAEVKLPVEVEPLVGSDPLQPPEAVQAVASVELQVSVDAEPLVTVVGLAVSVTVGAGGGVVFDPPPEPQAVRTVESASTNAKRSRTSRGRAAPRRSSPGARNMAGLPVLAHVVEA